VLFAKVRRDLPVKAWVINDAHPVEEGLSSLIGILGGCWREGHLLTAGKEGQALDQVG
jgi:hypothetical protein